MQRISSLVALCLAWTALAAPQAIVPLVSDSLFLKAASQHICTQRYGCAPQSQSVDFLRALNPTLVDHFYTANVQEMSNAIQNLGYTKPEGPPGRVFPSDTRGTVAFYRGFQPTVHDRFYTTNEQEMNNAVANLGYSREGIAAYIYSTQVCGSIPLYRTYNGEVVDHFYTTNEQERDNSIQNLGYSDEGIAGYILPLQ